MWPVAKLMIPGICGPGMVFQIDGFRLIYLGIGVLMWFVSGVFSLEYMAHYEKKSRYYLFLFATFFATMGVFLSADFYTTFIFFEIMSFTSYVWVAFDEKEESLRAAKTYLAVAVIGGMVMLMGLFLLYDLTKTLRFDELGEAASHALSTSPGRLYAASGLLLFGFGAKAGCFPLHIWLPKAHPVAPAPASALLSGILTKTGVFGIIVISCQMLAGDRTWGMLIVCLGLVTMFLGALLALFSVNLKRTLACSSVSQIGFILTGIGMGDLLQAAGESGSLAVRGAFLHMVNHSLFKLVLFLCAAAVFMNLHQLDLNDIRGFGRKKPLLMFCFLMGALGIGGVPFWNGYVSKTLLHESIVEYRFCGAASVCPALWQGAEWIFLVSGGMTVAYMLKLFVALFVDRHPSRQEEFDALSLSYMRPAGKWVLAGTAVLLPFLGMTSHLSMDKLADLGQEFFGQTGHAHPIFYFSLENLKGGLISIGIGMLLYTFVIRRWMMGEKENENKEKGGKITHGMCYLDRWPSWLDLEELFYRPVLQVVLPGIGGWVCGFLDRYVITAPMAVFLAVSAVACRAMDQMADSVIRMARKTTHSQIPPAFSLSMTGDGEALGSRTACGVERRWGSPGIFARKRRERTRAALIRIKERIQRNGRLVEESFSFGLMLFAIGLSGVSSFGFYSSVKEFVIPFFLTETFAGSIMKRILKKVCRKKRRYEKEGDVQSRKNYDGFADSGRPDFYGLW